MVINENIINDLEELSERFKGDIYLDESTRILYATDASVYREIPQAVTRPKDIYDIIELVEFAKKHNASLIPRGAGTSLAGQVVGYGIVVDIGKYMTQILEVNEKERWVRVQPGVVLDELNLALEQYGLFFSPETSSSNRCMIGGMVGNNSCGARSIVYGSTRDHLLSVKAVLSDSSIVEFGPISTEEFHKKTELKTLEGEIYEHIYTLLLDPVNQKEINEQFPDKSIRRRNTGYAIDLLLDSQPFNNPEKEFNFSTLLAGSEGTLAFFSEFKLHLDPLPPKVKALVCVHCNTLEDALKGNLIALEQKPQAVELMDRTVMELSKQNISQNKNRFFIKGDPEAILIIEFAADTEEKVRNKAIVLEENMKSSGFGYHFPLILDDDIPKVWSVRKAGLGLLSNMVGDAKPVPFVEDTAVKVEDLPDYIKEFKQILKKFDLDCAYYAHIGTGELHLRPVLNLKDPLDVEIYRTIAKETASLVKKYRGSLSGEHGDGRLRSEFIQDMIGEINFEFLKEIKRIWDPENIFNEGKIFNSPPMNTFLRNVPIEVMKEPKTIFDFTNDIGFLESVEKCNGSGDCRKTEIFEGTMCPSYQASRDEKNTTRARANMLREIISRAIDTNPFSNDEIFDVLDLCLSCKGCKSECPSNVDMAKLKAEFLYQYYRVHKVPFRTKAIAHYHDNYKIGSLFPGISNIFLKSKFTSGIIKYILGISPKRSLPLLYKTTMHEWLKKNNGSQINGNKIKGEVNFFIDEFTDYNDTEIGVKAVKLLMALGYKVNFPEHTISGRSYISKSFLKNARRYAEINVSLLKDIVSPSNPLIGIEPSAILTFRDEYPELLRGQLQKDAKELAKSALLFEEFICREITKGNISKEQFSDEIREIKLHGHCQQKAISSTDYTIRMLNLPENYQVSEIPSGCCGMAGSFGYEKEHYDLSMKIGEMVLFPEVRKTESDVIIAAVGTSCRHQIKDGTNREAKHPVEILFDALKK